MPLYRRAPWRPPQRRRFVFTTSAAAPAAKRVLKARPRPSPAAPPVDRLVPVRLVLARAATGRGIPPSSRPPTPARKPAAARARRRPTPTGAQAQAPAAGFVRADRRPRFLPAPVDRLVSVRAVVARAPTGRLYVAGWFRASCTTKRFFPPRRRNRVFTGITVLSVAPAGTRPPPPARRAPAPPARRRRRAGAGAARQPVPCFRRDNRRPAFLPALVDRLVAVRVVAARAPTGRLFPFGRRRPRVAPRPVRVPRRARRIPATVAELAVVSCACRAVLVAAPARAARPPARRRLVPTKAAAPQVTVPCFRRDNRRPKFLPALVDRQAERRVVVAKAPTGRLYAAGWFRASCETRPFRPPRRRNRVFTGVTAPPPPGKQFPRRLPTRAARVLPVVRPRRANRVQVAIPTVMAVASRPAWVVLPPRGPRPVAARRRAITAPHAGRTPPPRRPVAAVAPRAPQAPPRRRPAVPGVAAPPPAGAGVIARRTRPAVPRPAPAAPARRSPLVPTAPAGGLLARRRPPAAVASRVPVAVAVPARKRRAWRVTPTPPESDPVGPSTRPVLRRGLCARALRRRGCERALERGLAARVLRRPSTPAG